MAISTDVWTAKAGKAHAIRVHGLGSDPIVVQLKRPMAVSLVGAIGAHIESYLVVKNGINKMLEIDALLAKMAPVKKERRKKSAAPPAKKATKEKTPAPKPASDRVQLGPESTRFLAPSLRGKLHSASRKDVVAVLKELEGKRMHTIDRLSKKLHRGVHQTMAALAYVQGTGGLKLTYKGRRFEVVKR